MEEQATKERSDTVKLYYPDYIHAEEFAVSEKGTVGKPKYARRETVRFVIIDDNGQRYVSDGEIFITDVYGTFEQKEEPSYDIICISPLSELCFGEEVLFKHIPESFIIDKTQNT